MERHRGFQVGNESAPREVLWIHGYTGSPDAFLPIANTIARELDAFVSVPLLPGHGTEEHHLIGHSFDDFVSSTRHFADRIAAKKKPFAFVGYSFGGFLAALMARDYKPSALVLALTPYRVRFPFWLPGISMLLGMRPFWDKFLTKEDIQVRRGTFYYPDFPGIAFSFTKVGDRRLEEILPQLTMPILTLNTDRDPLIRPDSGKLLLAASGRNPANEWHVVPHDRHALFFPPNHQDEESVLLDFLKKNLQ